LQSETIKDDSDVETSDIEEEEEEAGRLSESGRGVAGVAGVS
jgi:hypothetical protein